MPAHDAARSGTVPARVEPGSRALPRPPRAAARLGVALLTLAVAGAPRATPLRAQGDDPFLWLENVEDARALAWAEEQNAITRDKAQAYPGYQRIYDQTLEILTSTDRIAFPSIRGEHIYNFWTDGDHPRGVYRRTSWESYLSGDPAWETVLDVDALAEADDTPWAFAGMTCLGPEDRYCMVALARGGSDAVEAREFDLLEKRFVEGGFRIPEAKMSLAWVDRDHLLVAAALEGTPTTTSGYPSRAVVWERGTPLAEARTVAETVETDMGIFLGSMETPRGSEPTVNRLETIFTSEVRLLRDGRLVPVPVPMDAQAQVMGDQLVVQLVSDWTVGGRTFREGSIVSTDFEAFLAGGREVELVLEPGERSTINGVTSTRDYLLVNQLTDVQSELLRFTRDGERWVRSEIEVPPMGSVGIGARSDEHNRFFFTFSSFATPQTLYLAQEDGSIREVASLPHQFDADDVVVEQFHATSADGTRVPYFVVRQASARMDGTNPTLLYAYGGFQISRTPSYLGHTGKNWVEAGGVYVLANIRGGGEFGPSWWKAGLKENRQRVYDDFIAVSEDLIARGITSPDHLGIMGGSNGGLLVGVAMTQRPDLYEAVVVQVPLLDMKRYHTLLAGASWMAEYGNPDVPEEWAYISRYSPYQNVEADVEYPEAFIWTTTRDDRVHPGHARKMAALMMSQGHPVRYFENTEGGHGSGVTPDQQAEIQALTMAYLFQKLFGGRPSALD